MQYTLGRYYPEQLPDLAEPDPPPANCRSPAAGGRHSLNSLRQGHMQQQLQQQLNESFSVSHYLQVAAVGLSFLNSFQQQLLPGRR